MFKNFVIITFFFLFFNSCSGVDGRQITYEVIKNRFNSLNELFLRGEKQRFLDELNSMRNISKRNAEQAIRAAILNSKNNQDQLSEAIFLAGFLKLKRLSKMIQRIHSTDIITNLNKYYYFYNTKKNKKIYLAYFKYFTEALKYSTNLPPIIGDGAYHAIYLMGWLFEKEVLDYLSKFGYEKLDAGLSEIYSYSLDRVKVVLQYSKN